MKTAIGFPSITHPAARLPARFLRPYRLVLVAMLALVLPACKIVVTVPFGGKVVTEDGFACLSGQTCEVDVADATFDSTFTAVPAAGYTFARWRPKTAAFCGNFTAPCRLSTIGFDAYSALLDILDSDTRFFLEPMFIQYNLSYWQQVLSQLGEGTFATEAFLYAIKPNTANCDPGGLTDAAKERALQAVNQVRSLHRLPAVVRDSFYDMQVQEASLVQKANNYLSHTPAPGDACYTAGAKEGAATSNLFGGNQPSDPASDVFGWTNDKNNLAALMEAGHRRWVLHPQLGYISYGQVLGRSALKVFGFGMQPTTPVPASLEFVAMPFESYPWVLVSQGAAPTPWSVSMVPPMGMSSAFNYFQNATVTVTDNDSGASLPVLDLHKDNKGFGLSNFLSWMVAGWEYDKPYTVRISAISMPGGGVRTIEYPVVIDRYQLFNVDHPLESGDTREGTILRGNFNAAKDRDSYQLSLVGTKTISGQSEFSNQAFFILVYDSGKRLVHSSDTAFTRDFPLDQYTVVVSPCDENGLCYQSTKTYQVSISP